jgi:hypothetical protein
VIRYPVDLKSAGEIDERVTHEVLKALAQEPKVQLAGGADIQLSAPPGGDAKS